MESTKTRILKKLLETDGYLSGQELCEQLGVSRTAVWKYMKQLKEEGYEIEAVQNKGYCLKDVPDVLGESEIKSRLHTRWAGQTLYYYDEIDSLLIEWGYLKHTSRESTVDRERDNYWLYLAGTLISIAKRYNLA